MRDAATRILLWATAVAVVAVVVVVASGEKDEPAAPPAADVAGDEPAAGQAGGNGAEATAGDGGEHDGGGGSGATGGTGARGEAAGAAARERLGRAAERSYRAYVDAINARDGAALCRLLAPGFLGELKPSERRPSCAATMRASIGYEDPRRFPVWEATVLSGLEQIEVEPAAGTARVTAAVITRFADRTEPSVESDIAYLGRAGDGGRVRLLKASGVLWRAVGKPDYPPSVISPP